MKYKIYRPFLFKSCVLKIYNLNPTNLFFSFYLQRRSSARGGVLLLQEEVRGDRRLSQGTGLAHQQGEGEGGGSVCCCFVVFVLILRSLKNGIHVLIQMSIMFDCDLLH